jgi:hypothetical protein
MKIWLSVCALLAAACASAGTLTMEPVVVLYWDGASLITITPGSNLMIPAGAVYAIDSMGGVGVILAAMPGTPSPDPNTVPSFNTSNPSITTPSGLTFSIPDPGNVSSINQSGGDVTVNYNDGSSATTPGTSNPPGSPAPTPPPAEQPTGPPFSGPDTGFEGPLTLDLGDAPWINNFLGSAIPPADIPNFKISSFFDVFTDLALDTVQFDTPEPGSIMLTGAGLILVLAAALRRMGRVCSMR